MLQYHMKKRALATLLLVAFLLVTSFSAAFLFTHTEHTHDHNGPENACAVCIQLDSARYLLKNIFVVVLIPAAALSLFLIITAIVYRSIDIMAFRTLVSLKVRLDN